MIWYEYIRSKIAGQNYVEGFLVAAMQGQSVLIKDTM